MFEKLRIMVGDFMTKKGLRLIKFLYAVFFEKKTAKVLLIKNGSKFELPGGGKVFFKDISKFADERWKRSFYCKNIPLQTGIASYCVEQETQSMPANYEVYDFVLRQELSAIIVGEINSYQVTNKNARFYTFDQIKKLIKEGKITRGQELLIWRALVSRDCPEEKIRIAAARLLREKHR